MNVYIMNRICNDVLIEPHLQPVPAGNSLVGASANMLLEAWANKLLYSTNGSPPCCPIKEKLHIVP